MFYTFSTLIFSKTFLSSLDDIRNHLNFVQIRFGIVRMSTKNLLRFRKTLITLGIIISTLGSGMNFAWALKPVMVLGRTKNLVTEVTIRIFLKSHHIHSLEDYAQWLTRNLRYQRDGHGSQWLRPEETLRNGFGDCKDLAFLNQAVLRALGYQPHVLAFVRQGYGHAFCIFKINDAYAIFDNTQLITTKTSSLKDIVQYVYTHENAKVFLELRMS